MPDITKCTNEKCPQKDSCYRHKSEPSIRQSYCKFEYVDGKCGYYWPIKDEDWI